MWNAGSAHFLEEAMMADKYFYTLQDDGEEEVLHVGMTGTLVRFKGGPGLAAALAEMKRASGQPAIAKELSVSEFEQTKERAAAEKIEFEASQPKISLDP